jgi:hypothetical protein
MAKKKAAKKVAKQTKGKKKAKKKVAKKKAKVVLSKREADLVACLQGLYAEAKAFERRIRRAIHSFGVKL